MASLREYSERLARLLVQLTSTADSHNSAKAMIAELEGNQSAALQGVGLHLRFQTGVDIPVPLPNDRDQLLDLLHASGNFLGQEAIRIWGEIKQLSDEANAICAQVVAAHQQDEQRGGDSAAALPPRGS